MPRGSRPSWPPKSSRSSIANGFTVRAAHNRTGIAAADFSRIRHADLGRFTNDELMGILSPLSGDVRHARRDGKLVQG